MFPFNSLVPFRDEPFELQWNQNDRAQGRGVLVADDAEAIRGLLAAFFRRHGVTCRLARNGFEAIDTFRANHDRIGLVLLDVRMPDLDGPHTLARLQELNPDVVCYFMSGDFSLYTEDRLREMGARGLLMKPGLMPALDDILTDFLEREHDVA